MSSRPAHPTSSFEASRPPGLRLGALDGLRAARSEDPDGFVRLVLSTFRRTIDRYLPELDQARRRGDAVTARRVVHTLKSSSLQIGADEFGTTCAALELAIVEQGLDHPAVSDGLDQLPAGAETVRAMINELIGPEAAS